ncbi:hypothetical protein M3J09_011701 [Ascochyta lentis]
MLVVCVCVCVCVCCTTMHACMYGGHLPYIYPLVVTQHAGSLVADLRAFCSDKRI